jgi:hypothetical protein
VAIQISVANNNAKTEQVGTFFVGYEQRDAHTVFPLSTLVVAPVSQHTQAQQHPHAPIMFGMSLPVKPRDREALPLGSSLTKRSLAPWRAGMLLQRDKSARHALLRFRPRVRVNNSNNHHFLLRQTASSGSAHTLATAGSAASLGHVKTADNNSSNAAMPRAANPLLFLQESCPPDVLPLILAFCGPQQAAVLQRTNRHWRDLLAEETTWKVLCQELYKVRLS